MASRRVLCLVGAASLSWVCQATPAAQNPASPNQIPIAFEDPRVVPADPIRQRPAQISITLRNTGTKTIVGWGITFEIRHSNGRITRRGRLTDSVGMIDLDWRGEPILTPSGRYTFTDVDSPGPDLSQPVDVAATATYAIFVDDTAVGDEKLIAARFAKRAVHHQIWLKAEQALGDALRSGGSPETVLRAADDLMETVTDPTLRTDGTYAAARRLLTQPAARAPASSAAILERLRRDIPKRRQALEAHLVRQK